MLDLGTQELIVIFIVAFLVFGPKKLPELGRTLGKGIRELKAAMRGVKDSLDEAGSEMTEELKEAKSSLEDSIYESIEPHIEDKNSTDKTDKDQKKNNKSTASEEGATEVKETEKDG